MSAYANTVVGHLLAQSWQIALLAGIVGLISLALRNRSAHLRYLLWLIVLAKCLAPPVVTVPLAVLPDRPEIPPVGLTDFSEERSASEVPVFVGQDPKPRQSARTVPDVREVVALAWMAGVLFFLLWVGGRTIRYTAWLRERRKPLSSDLWASVENSSLGFRFRKWPRIWLLDEIRQPFVWGLLRGSVYLPADFAGVGDSDRQRNILAHEFSHVARFDAGVNLLQILAQAVYWFHPFVWWANRRIRQEREKCCDEMAVARLHTPPERYTGAIVEALAAEHRSAHPIPSLAIVGSVKDIEERIRTMLKPGKIFRTRPTLLAATVASLIALVTVPTALVLTARGQTPPTQAADNPAVHSEESGRRFPRMISLLVDKPATDSEKADQPRYAARTFNSKMAFEVRVNQEIAGSYRGLFGTSIGSTPSDTPLEIPACPLWHVRPATPVGDWDLLIREIDRNKIPGLALPTITDSDLRHLANLSGLEFLDLTEAPITDAGLVHLKGLTGLWGLNLRGTKVTGPGLEQLKGLTGLEFLDLMGTPVTDAGLQHLQELKGLRRVNLWATGVTDAGLAHLQDVTGLQTVNLNDTKITGAGLESLKEMSGLRGLSARWTQISDADLVHLERLTELRSLDFIGVGITSLGLEHLKGLTKLQQLNLNRTKVTDSGLANLAGLTELTGLWLAYTPLTDVGLAHFGHLTKLRQLGLVETQVTDATVVDLVRKQSGLQELGLAGTRITDVGLTHLKGLGQLWLLNLDGTQITDTGLAHLKGLTGLQELGLSASKVTDAGLVHIEGL
jgi:beta-lactamase regulating signal transducer with metallopeptidase domain/Leucine-rich repeat (LRR) protein